jgi:hypothetical protein
MDRMPPDIVPPAAEMTLDWSCTSTMPKTNRALRYWDEKRRERAMPARCDIAPFEITDILPIVQLYDLIDGGASYRVRLFGTVVARLFDKDPTGNVFDRASNQPLVTRMLTVFDHVVLQRKPLIARAEHTAIEKVNHSSIESIFLPLSDNGTDINMIFAATVVLPPRRALQLANG